MLSPKSEDKAWLALHITVVLKWFLSNQYNW